MIGPHPCKHCGESPLPPIEWNACPSGRHDFGESKPDEKFMSHFEVGECGVLNDVEFIVTDRGSEDRASGSTHVLFRTGLHDVFMWDLKNPKATPTGVGKRTVTIEWPTPEPKPRPTFAQLVMEWTRSLSKRSTCSRLQVGCMIVSPDYRKIISLGYNGGARGQENDCASLENGLCGHLHAETNAIINCDVPRSTPKIVFCTDLPCPMCSKMIVNLGGVERVVYGRDYRIKDGLDILRRAYIATEMFDVEKTR